MEHETRCMSNENDLTKHDRAVGADRGTVTISESRPG